MKFNVLAAAIVAFSFSVATASSAALVSSDGSVLVNTGKGFKAPKSNMKLKTGDRVLIKKGSNASISFDGCTVNISKGMVYTVPAKAPCLPGKNVFDISQPTSILASIEPVHLVGGLIVGGAVAIVAISRP